MSCLKFDDLAKILKEYRKIIKSDANYIAGYGKWKTDVENLFNNVEDHDAIMSLLKCGISQQRAILNFFDTAVMVSVFGAVISLFKNLFSLGIFRACGVIFIAFVVIVFAINFKKLMHSKVICYIECISILNKMQI